MKTIRTSRLKTLPLCLTILIGLFTGSCAKDSKNFGADNVFIDGITPAELSLFSLLDNYPALKSTFTKLDAAEFNYRLAVSLERNKGASVGAMRALEHITLNTNSGLREMTAKLSALLTRMRTGDPVAYRTALGMMERIRRSPYDFLAAVIPLRNAGLAQTYYGKTDAEVTANFIKMAELLEGTNLTKDFEDFLLKSVRSDGVIRPHLLSILSGIFDPTLSGDRVFKDHLMRLVGGVGDALNNKAGFSSTKTAENVIKELIVNLEKYNTTGGAVYTAVADYQNAGHSSELTGMLNEIFVQIRLLIDPTANGATIANPGNSLFEELAKNMYRLDFTRNVSEVDDSLRKLIAMDLYGRDRSSNINSEPISALESLVFVLTLADIYGYNWTNNSGGSYANPNITGMTGGQLTVADAMHALQSQLSGTTLGIMSVLDSQVTGEIKKDGVNFTLSHNTPALGLLQGESRGELISDTDPVYTKTVPWVMGWLKRVVYEGYGPYYNRNRINSLGQYTTPDGSVYDTSAAGRFKSQWTTSTFKIRIKNNNWADLQGNEIADGSASPGTSYTINEIISQNDPSRAVDSDEEALYKNFQWLLNEKRFVLIIPVQARIQSGAYSGLKDAAYVTMIGNGLKGLMSAKPYCTTTPAECSKADNAKWKLSGQVAKTYFKPVCNRLVESDCGKTQAGNLVNFSSTPGDSVIITEVWGLGIAGGVYGFTDDTIWDAMYNSLMYPQSPTSFFGAIPPVVSQNFPIFERLSFLHENSVPSASVNSYWEHRNKLLPLVAALAKTFCDESNPGASVNAFPILTDLVKILARPYLTTGTEVVSGVGGITYLKVRGATGANSMRSPNMTQAEYYPDCQDDPFGNCNGTADNNMRMLVSLLSENNRRFQDGLLNLVGRSNLLTGLTGMLAELGAPDRAPGRAKFMSGLKGFITNTKLTAEAPAAFQFDIGTLFTDIVNKLAAYPDTRSTDLTSTDWEGVDDVVSLTRDFLSNGPYGLLNNLSTLFDTLIYANPSDTELTAFMDILVAILTESDGTTPAYRLHTILTQDAPAMIRFSAPYARSLSGVLEGLTAPGGFTEYMQAKMYSDYSLDDLIQELERFANDPIIQSRDYNLNNILFASGTLIKQFADIGEFGRKMDVGGYIFEDRWNITESGSSLFDRMHFILSRK